MSNALLKKRVYTWKEFKDADELDRLWMHMMQPEELILTDKEYKRLALLKSIFSMMQNHQDELEVAYEILEVYPYLRNLERVWKEMTAAKQIFADIIGQNKEFDRMIIRKKLKELAFKASKAGNLQEERRCYQAIMRLDALDIHEEGTAINPKEILPPKITFTSDPRVFEEAQVVRDEEE